MVNLTSNEYSILNDYIYPNKKRVYKIIDYFSAPIRIALGGKSVTIGVTYSNPIGYSTMARVRAVALSILIFPVGIVAALAFIAKILSNESTLIYPLLKSVLANS